MQRRWQVLTLVSVGVFMVSLDLFIGFDHTRVFGAIASALGVAAALCMGRVQRASAVTRTDMSKPQLVA
jgi:hypothetical protein